MVAMAGFSSCPLDIGVACAGSGPNGQSPPAEAVPSGALVSCAESGFGIAAAFALAGNSVPQAPYL